MSPASVRYIVDDVDAAIAFYRDLLGFAVEMHPAPSFAMLSRGDLRLLLSAPSGQGGGGQVLPGGRRPEPGGWNRFRSRSTASPPRWSACARPARPSAARSCTASAATRSSSRTRRATPWSSSSPIAEPQ